MGSIPNTNTSDRWHKVLDALYTDGIMAELQDREYRVLHVMLLLRNEQGVAYAPMPDLMRLTGYSSPRNIQLARKGLLTHPRRLLAESGTDKYVVLPEWLFAGRTIMRPDAHDHAPVAHVGAPKAHNGAPQSQAARASENSKDKRREEFDDECLSILTAEGKGRVGGPFTEADAKGLIRQVSPDQIRTAIRNADAMAKGGKLKTWRGYVASQLLKGCTLLAPLQAEDDATVQNRDALVRAVGWLVEQGAEDEASAVQMWWNGLEAPRRSRCMSGRERGLDNEKLAAVLVQKAAERAGM